MANQNSTPLVAQVMTLMNVWKSPVETAQRPRILLQEGIETVGALLAPITPHICHELWQPIRASTPVIDDFGTPFDADCIGAEHAKHRDSSQWCVVILTLCHR